ncbi:hypothetical protein CONLIGDRAFT_643807 [Coniochaeta ligniaria NRRL 30616]|uniref:C2H2-type domain-containing protein n=1 Tax=Coniochaeta ligniaria NRRL 30616 TaxID=1408157 RepID=A0A1J7JKE4_9PEZI|nr:hypothetical protein CONLIGDRAFT_643807 [Coniochaeta ligniaria NRRL 30616]
MAQIESASDQMCRKILTALCDDPKIRQKAFSCLRAYQPKPGTKRKAVEAPPEVYLCKYCGDAFLEENNIDTEACCHHPGELEFDDDSDTWVDWPYWDDDMDTEDMRKEYPGGFTWNCCDEPGDGSSGCEAHAHVAVNNKRQKASSKTAAKPAVTVDLTQ